MPGIEATQPETTPQGTCPSCGASVALVPGRSCPSCGAPLQVAATDPQAASAPGSPPPGPEADGAAAAGAPQPQSAGYAAPPPAPQMAAGALDLPQSARDVSMWTHLSALVGLLGIPSVVGPLIVWLLKRESHPFVDDQGKEAVNFNISVLIYALGVFFIGFIFTVVTLGLGFLLLLPLMLAVIVAWAVFVIIAAVRSSKGEAYRYPLTIRMVN
jgi:uncharacterized Tic20 family protein